MKKFLALTCALALTASMAVCAADSPSATSVVASGSGSAVVATAPAVPIIQQLATSYGKTVTEYAANAITYTPGLPNAAVISQGGGCVINGAKSNATFTLNRVESGAAAYAVSLANSLGGTVLNVVDISAPGVHFEDAEVGFYVEGVKAGDKVAVYQAIKGEWVAVEVLGVSDNGVTVKMNTKGIYSFIKL